MHTALLLTLFLAHAPVHASKPAPLPTSRVDVQARSTADGNLMQGHIAVPGTVRQLRPLLLQLERWPTLFPDARALQRKPSGVWSIDFAAFGHAHDFHATRTSAGLMLALAQAGHGSARLEYSLRPLDARHVTLAVRFVVPTPPGFTPEQMQALLRMKALSDLEAFARAAPGALPAKPSSQH